MWHLLDDDVLSHIATIGAWESLHVLRQLERRCAQIEKAKTRLRCIRPLFFPPFSFRWKEMSILELRLAFNKIGDDGMQAFASAVASGSLASLKMVGVDPKHMRHPQLMAARQARGIEIEIEW